MGVLVVIRGRKTMFDNPTPEEFKKEVESLIDDKDLEEIHKDGGGE